jgi:hypothetical protein
MEQPQISDIGFCHPDRSGEPALSEVERGSRQHRSAPRSMEQPQLSPAHSRLASVRARLQSCPPFPFPVIPTGEPRLLRLAAEGSWQHLSNSQSMEQLQNSPPCTLSSPRLSHPAPVFGLRWSPTGSRNRRSRMSLRDRRRCMPLWQSGGWASLQIAKGIPGRLSLRRVARSPILFSWRFTRNLRGRSGCATRRWFPALSIELKSSVV